MPLRTANGELLQLLLQLQIAQHGTFVVGGIEDDAIAQLSKGRADRKSQQKRYQCDSVFHNYSLEIRGHLVLCVIRDEKVLREIYLHAVALSNGYVVPEQGWFLSSREDLAKAFQPEQTSYICIRVAMFADGLRDFEKAENWTLRAISLAEKHEEARDVVATQAKYAFPSLLLKDDFARAGKLFSLFAKSTQSSITQRLNSAAGTRTPEQEELVRAALSNSPAPAISLSKSSSAIPITLRLATRLLQGASVEEVAAAIAAV